MLLHDSSFYEMIRYLQCSVGSLCLSQTANAHVYDSVLASVIRKNGYEAVLAIPGALVPIGAN